MKIEIEDLKKVKLDVDDILVVTFDPEKIYDEEMKGTVECLKEVFPKNRILFNPNTIELSVMSKEVNPKLNWIKEQRSKTSKTVSELNNEWDLKQYHAYEKMKRQ